MKLRWKLGLITVISLLITTFITASFTRWVVSDAMEIRQEDSLKMGAISIQQTNDLNLYDDMEIAATVIQDGKVTAASSAINYMIGSDANLEAEQIAREQGEYFTTEMLAGKESYSYYLYDDAQDVVLCMFQEAKLFKKNVITILSVLFAGAITSCIFCTIVASWLINRIVKRLIVTTNKVSEIASKDFTVRFDDLRENSKDEIVKLQQSMNQMTTDLADAISTVIKMSDDVTSSMGNIAEQNSNITASIGDISKAVEEIAEGAVSQATETSTATANIEEMNANIETIKSSTYDLTESAKGMSQTKDNVLQTLDQMQGITGSVAESVQHTSEQIAITQEVFKTIQETLGAIDDISSQTNLLSLNASIEAAHAGDAGRGFAVVATEIRKLADDSAKSAEEIDNVVKELSINFQKIIDEFTVVNENIIKQNEMSALMKNDFEQLGEQVNHNITQIDEIQTMLDIISSASEAVTDIIVNLSSISEENSAGAEQTTASIQELDSTITQINDKIQSVKEQTYELQKKMGEFIIS